MSKRTEIPGSVKTGEAALTLFKENLWLVAWMRKPIASWEDVEAVIPHVEAMKSFVDVCLRFCPDPFWECMSSVRVAGSVDRDKSVCAQALMEFALVFPPGMSAADTEAVKTRQSYREAFLDVVREQTRFYGCEIVLATKLTRQEGPLRLTRAVPAEDFRLRA